jgi:hypothetical protein
MISEYGEVEWIENKASLPHFKIYPGIHGEGLNKTTGNIRIINVLSKIHTKYFQNTS